MANEKVQAILRRHQSLRNLKTLWDPQFDLISEYVMGRKYDFQSTNSPGEFLNRDIFSMAAGRLNSVLSSTLIGALWPNGARSVKLIHPEGLSESEEVKGYFDFATRLLTSVMDDPRAGFSLALNEYMLDQGSFGTSAIAVFEQADPQVPVIYKPWNVKTMALDEGPNGFIDTVYNLREVTVRSLVMEYGLENVSDDSRRNFMEGNEMDKIKVLHVIEPRVERDPRSFGSKDKPIASIHIEMGIDKVIREGGFDEMPILVGRFSKGMGEVYGRSPAMHSLPEILQLNTIMESTFLAIEQKLRPALGVLDDGVLGAGTIDFSSGAVNVFDVTGRLGSDNPVFPLFNVGELQSTEKLIEILEQRINSAFFLDRLLDLNNDTRMTFGEAQIRNKLRGESVGPIFARQETEIFTPAINRTMSILFRRGRLGVVEGSEQHADFLKRGVEPRIIPQAVANALVSGEDFFRVQFISPAKRIMHAEETAGILTSFDFALQNQPVAPNILDNINSDRSFKLYSELNGTPPSTLNSEEEVQKIREDRAKQQAELQAQEDARNESEIQRNQAQAQATLNPRPQS